MKLSTIDNPDSFLKAIPRDLVENINFRQNLHSYLATDIAAQKVYLEMCFAQPQIAFNSAFWVYDADSLPGYRNRPFILREPKQTLFVDRIKHAIDYQHDLVADKSRREGATEIICKMYTLYWWLSPLTSFLIGSRKEDLVDQSTEIKHGIILGPHQCLFHKILYAINTLPAWVKINFLKKHKFLQNLDNGAMIEGEATNESFGAGNRAVSVLVDEVARIEPPIAQNIIDNIRETSKCCIYNSTHFKWGSGHPYAKLLRSNKIEVVTLGFEDNPEKNQGLYCSPSAGVIQIKDIDYYRSRCKLFNNIESMQSIAVDPIKKELQEYDIRFVADGGELNFGRDRSIWFDAEEIRSQSKMDIAQNILRIAQGSADQFFDPEMIHRLRATYSETPRYKGDIKFDIIKNKITNIKFTTQSHDKLFYWWGKLDANYNPDITHNYIVSCDISRGTGASNSVLAVCDINTQEICGLFASAYIDVSDFAELAIATCKWLDNAYLIWEANGPGDTFDKRLVKYGYNRVYINRNERSIKHDRSMYRGWRSTPGPNGSKMDMLTQLDAALGESLKHERLYRYLVLHDAATINELEDYMFDVHKIDVKPSNSIDETTGAQYAHGDRVIAVGLCVLAMNEAHPADLRRKKTPPVNSFEHRYRKWQGEKEENKQFIRERW